VGEGTGDAQTQRLLPGLEKVYPGLTAEMNGRVSRFHWPSFRWSKGSYGCYKPGQWTTIRGAEGAPVNRLYFAGEHCSLDFQGYMNGAAETGQAAARGILRRVRR
jgi:monoamine oxidase